MRRSARSTLAAALLGTAFFSAAPASADQGVAIDLGRVEITQRLVAGGGYRLPVLGVSNPGDKPARYRMTVSYVTDQERREPPEKWFSFAPGEFALAPGETRAVRTGIALPVGADPGEYEALLGAQLVTSGRGGQVGAAAASRVTFTIEPSSTLQAVWLEIERFFREHGPWSYVVPALLLAVLASWQIRRRFSFSVARRA
jgi:hypothetical protein